MRAQRECTVEAPNQSIFSSRVLLGCTPDDRLGGVLANTPSVSTALRGEPNRSVFKEARDTCSSL